MDPEIVCTTKQGSPDFTIAECPFNVDSIVNSAASQNNHDIFPRNTNATNSSISSPAFSDPPTSKPASGLECNSGGTTIEVLEESDATPSPNELLNTYDSGINLMLENEELWGKFRDVHTEMIITKSGR